MSRFWHPAYEPPLAPFSLHPLIVLNSFGFALDWNFSFFRAVSSPNQAIPYPGYPLTPIGYVDKHCRYCYLGLGYGGHLPHRKLRSKLYITEE
jgi:hypothetical protein